MMISGGKDKLILPEQMAKLKENAVNSKFVEWKFEANGGHNDTWEQAGKNYFIWVQDFLKKCLNNT